MVRKLTNLLWAIPFTLGLSSIASADFRGDLRHLKSMNPSDSYEVNQFNPTNRALVATNTFTKEVPIHGPHKITWLKNFTDGRKHQYELFLMAEGDVCRLDSSKAYNYKADTWIDIEGNEEGICKGGNFLVEKSLYPSMQQNQAQQVVVPQANQTWTQPQVPVPVATGQPIWNTLPSQPQTGQPSKSIPEIEYF